MAEPLRGGGGVKGRAIKEKITFFGELKRRTFLAASLSVIQAQTTNIVISENSRNVIYLQSPNPRLYKFLIPQMWVQNTLETSQNIFYISYSFLVFLEKNECWRGNFYFTTYSIFLKKEIILLWIRVPNNDEIRLSYFSYLILSRIGIHKIERKENF